MDMLLILTYTAICIVLFKLFRVPVNKWTVPTAALGGAFLLGGIYGVMNYSHPYSSQAREYFYATPISPTVRGRVIDVPVEPNTPLKAGDVLFKIDPKPFQDKVDELTARLKEAKKNLGRYQEMMRKNLGRQLDVDQTQSRVDALQAELHKAEFDLDQTIVRAPTDGSVTQLFLKPGMIAVPIPLRPVMVFITQQQDLFVGWFRQNNLMRVKPGFEAEVAFDAIPGRVFKAKVSGVQPYMAEGQMQPNGVLLTDNNRISGMVPVKLKITDPAFAEYRDQLPGGSYAQAAVYSDKFEDLSIIRKVLLRMASWMNYIFPID